VLNRFFAALLLGPVGAVAAQTDIADPGYFTHAQLTERARQLGADAGDACAVESIGTSREGREIIGLRLALPGAVEPESRPALLLVANIDGDHLVGSSVALSVAERLMSMAEAGDDAAVAFLTDHTLYVVPRVNPDAAERFFADVRSERRRNMRPDDHDRDGAVDEDGPNDLNGDGLVTMMRVFDPEKADRMADESEPRLDVKPDRDKGERASFVLYAEGVDDDGDSEHSEDDLGGVDLNMNFMHGYKEHADGAGPHQVSEPESLALLQYALDRQNIAVVLVYGLHDNLSKPPDGKGKVTGGGPKNVESDDVGLYKQISERFVEITGLKKAPGGASAGSFHAWAYAQFGVPSFTTPLWTRPEPVKEDSENGDGDGGDGGKGGDGDDGDDGGKGDDGDDTGEDDGLTPSGIGDISQETMDELLAGAEERGFEVSDEMMSQLTPQRVEGFAGRMGIKIRRVKTANGGGGAKNKEDAAWLTYSDEQRDGAGFVAWAPFDHPEFGEVQIGGWVPYFKTNPPPDAIDSIALKQVEFVLELAGRFPDVSLTDPEITRLASGLYEVKAALVNDGYLPSGTAMAVKNRRARPWVVRLDIPIERVVTGQRVNKIWAVPGSGGREQMRWIVRGTDGSRLKITVYSEKFGQFEKAVNLQDNQESENAGGAS
jgi:hypothetical protein